MLNEQTFAICDLIFQYIMCEFVIHANFDKSNTVQERSDKETILTFKAMFKLYNLIFLLNRPTM